MKLRHQILGIGLAGAGMAAVVGGVGWQSASLLAEAYDGAVNIGQAVQNSQRAAMMHGALRGDVQRAMLGAMGRDKVQIEQARTALDAHAKSLDGALQALGQLRLSPDTKALLARCVPRVREYTEAASNLLKLGSGDSPAAAAVAVPAFEKLYAEVEALMTEQVDHINREERAFQSESRAIVARTRLVVVLVLLAAAGILAAAALALARHLSRPLAQASQVASTLARGELSVSVQPEGSDETIQLLHAMAAMQHSLGVIVRTVHGNAGEVAAASAQIAQGNQDLSSRTERQAAALEETTASMEQLSATFQRNAGRATQASALADEASRAASEGSAMVAQVDRSMRAILQSSAKVTEIVELVDGLSSRTNILAINAAVEAARAGASGRGFAVVAGEVRSLAMRSAEAAREIAALIQASSDLIAAGSAHADRARQAMADVVARVQGVSNILCEISSAGIEQSAGVSQVEAAVVDIDRTTRSNQALVGQMAAAARGLKTRSDELLQSVAVFKLAPEADAKSA